MSVSLLKLVERDKSMAKYEWCKNDMLMGMWLKWNNHLNSKQKKSSIMQMTEAFNHFNGWRGFCDIQETVTQRGKPKGRHFKLVQLHCHTFLVDKYWWYLSSNLELQLTSVGLLTSYILSSSTENKLEERRIFWELRVHFLVQNVPKCTQILTILSSNTRITHRSWVAVHNSLRHIMLNKLCPRLD